MPRQLRPTGHQRAPSIGNTHLEPQTELVMKHGDDARAEELNNLKLALATFVLQLDAFEMWMHQGLPKGLPKIGKPGKPAPRTDGSGGTRKDN